MRSASRGVLDQRRTAWFEGLEIGCDDSQTASPAALHGVQNRICDLGLVLISVRRSDPE
jgi:hypothetical protein